MDNSWDCHGGEGEFRMGKALRDGYRDRVLLLTKVDGRSREAARRPLKAWARFRSWHTPSTWWGQEAGSEVCSCYGCQRCGAQAPP
jgi:predicted aldo/keto reductase-like oxidoreductase